MSIMPSEVASLIIPLENSSLLIPNSCVAEIIPSAAIEKDENAAEWVIGNFVWRELSLPCLSLETLLGISGEGAHSGNRVAVFNTISDKFSKRFYGVNISGLPRLSRVTEQEIVEEESEKSDFEIIKVQVSGEACIIPDLEAVEKLLSTAALS